MSRTLDPGSLRSHLEAFEDLRGDKTDRAWAEEVVFALRRADVATPAVGSVLRTALEVVEQSGESPEELFGPPRPWAEEQIVELRAQGRPVASADPMLSWYAVPAVGMVTAVALAAVHWVIAMVKGPSPMDFTVGVVAFPGVVGLTTIAALATWESVLARRPVWVAVGAALAVVTVGVGITVALIFATKGNPFAQASPGRYALVVVSYVLLASVFDWVLPEAKARPWTESLSDDEWARVAAGALRLRADMPESRVQTVISEARAHAGETGQTLHEEFGRAEDYAASFTRDEVTGSRRKALGYAALSVLGAVMAFVDGFSWIWFAAALAFALLALGRWMGARHRIARRCDD